ncbi:hypothetical protein ACTJK5_21810 [Agrobacterium sp. 22094]|uniref:hypothetical protein n=1 Tax=Agrobacterium sp. 22094 TaxID=3453872 RepID=UPI003F84B384
MNWSGLSGEKDWDLMPRNVAEDYTFVTNNARFQKTLRQRRDPCRLGHHRASSRSGIAARPIHTHLGGDGKRRRTSERGDRDHHRGR